MGPGPMFKFVASDGIGNSQKRHQARRACESCRRRKKACHHTGTPPAATSTVSRGSTPSSHVLNVPIVKQAAQGSKDGIYESTLANNKADHVSGDPNTSVLGEGSHDASMSGQTQTSDQLQHRQEDSNPRFIGDLNPEGLFLAATSPGATRGGSVGIWLTANANNIVSQQTNPIFQSSSKLFYSSPTLVQQMIVPLLEQQCLSALPSATNVSALTKIYFKKVYPILPVVDESDITKLSSTDPHHVLLQQGICLAASKNHAARQYLVLDGSEPLTCRVFGEKLSGAMRMSIEMGLVTKRDVIIQALVVMTQFTDNPIGDDLSSQLCSRVVHHVQSLGLHLNQDQVPSRQKLFCCVWAVDKLNAGLYGRPILMHDRDVSVSLSTYFGNQEPSFRLFLHVAELLDKVIDIYRPANSDNPIPFSEFPPFEDLVLDCGAQNIKKSTLASIETFYHAISILSCRSKTWADPQRSSSAYLRQSLSTAVLSSTASHALQDHQLTLFPFIPYAMSLAMSIAYREMRHSKLTIQRTRSRIQFQTLCDALTRLEGVFWSASATAEMGKKLLKEMDRVVSTVEKRDHHHLTMTPEKTSAATTVVHDSVMAGDQTTTNGSESTPVQMIQEVDSFMFGFTPDIDLFGMFDPAFDLDGFDACLEGNLNPAFPTNFQ